MDIYKLPAPPSNGAYELKADSGEAHWEKSDVEKPIYKTFYINDQATLGHLVPNRVFNTTSINIGFTGTSKAIYDGAPIRKTTVGGNTYYYVDAIVGGKITDLNKLCMYANAQWMNISDLVGGDDFLTLCEIQTQYNSFKL